jgi:hypothetical protein
MSRHELGSIADVLDTYATPTLSGTAEIAERRTKRAVLRWETAGTLGFMVTGVPIVSSIWIAPERLLTWQMAVACTASLLGWCMVLKAVVHVQTAHSRWWAIWNTADDAARQRATTAHLLLHARDTSMPRRCTPDSCPGLRDGVPAPEELAPGE